jgi:hypothetical protein
MCVDFLLHHRHHIERVPHGVKTQNARKNFETRSVDEKYISQCVGCFNNLHPV